MLYDYQPGAKEITLPARLLGINRSWLLSAITQQASFGALYEQIEQQQHEKLWQQRWPLVNIEQAIDDLRRLLMTLRQQQSSLQAPTSYYQGERQNEDLLLTA